MHFLQASARLILVNDHSFGIIQYTVSEVNLKGNTHYSK